VASGLPAGPELTQNPPDLVSASGLGPYIGTHFLLVENSANGVDGWATFEEAPITEDPQQINGATIIGQFVRAAISTGNLDPITQWSNVVQVA
jgi:hypothetical protein